MSATERSETEEFAKRGEEIYERDILPRLDPGDQGKAVAIEVETGDYEIDKNEVVATHRLREVEQGTMMIDPHPGVVLKPSWEMMMTGRLPCCSEPDRGRRSAQ